MMHWIASLAVLTALGLAAPHSPSTSPSTAELESPAELALEPTVMGPLTGVISTSGPTPWPLTASLTGSFTGTMNASLQFVGPYRFLVGTTVTPAGVSYVTRGRWIGDANGGLFYGRAFDPITRHVVDFEARYFSNGSISGGWR